LKIGEGLRRNIKLSGLVIPSVDGVTEAIALRNEHKMIAGAVATNYKGLRRKSTPTTRYFGFAQNVICRPSDTLAIAVIEHGVKLPGVSGHLDLAAILRAQTVDQGLWQGTPQLPLGALNERSGDRKWHAPNSGA
jgi:hypothetical protein